MRFEPKRVTLFCGHYGSGKTNLAVNYALALAASGRPAALADIDIVNPYFRSADSRAELESAGVEVIALPFAGSNVDLPSLPSAVYGLVERRDRFAVLDVGGDDRGAYALGRFSPYILAEDDYDMLFVVNFCRPLTRTAEEALDVMREISAVCPIPFTAIVNNTNVGPDTTADVIAAGDAQARALSALTGLPVAMTGAERDAVLPAGIENVFRLTLQKKII